MNAAMSLAASSVVLYSRRIQFTHQSSLGTAGIGKKEELENVRLDHRNQHTKIRRRLVDLRRRGLRLYSMILGGILDRLHRGCGMGLGSCE